SCSSCSVLTVSMAVVCGLRSSVGESTGVAGMSAVDIADLLVLATCPSRGEECWAVDVRACGAAISPRDCCRWRHNACHTSRLSTCFITSFMQQFSYEGGGMADDDQEGQPPDGTALVGRIYAALPELRPAERRVGEAVVADPVLVARESKIGRAHV